MIKEIESSKYLEEKELILFLKSYLEKYAEDLGFGKLTYEPGALDREKVYKIIGLTIAAIQNDINRNNVNYIDIMTIIKEISPDISKCPDSGFFDNNDIIGEALSILIDRVAYIDIAKLITFNEYNELFSNIYILRNLLYEILIPLPFN